MLYSDEKILYCFWKSGCYTGDDGNTGKQGQKEGGEEEGDGHHDSEHEGGDESMTEEGEKEGDGDQDDDHEGRDDSSRNEEAVKGRDGDEVKGNHVCGGIAPDAQVDEGEELDPITPLSIVRLPEPVNPPPAPSRNIVDDVPLRFIPTPSFSSVLAAENLPHVFAGPTPNRPPTPRPASPMFIPVNLPGLQTSSPRRTGRMRSPSDKKKKN